MYRISYGMNIEYIAIIHIEFVLKPRAISTLEVYNILI